MIVTSFSKQSSPLAQREREDTLLNLKCNLFIGFILYLFESSVKVYTEENNYIFISKNSIKNLVPETAGERVKRIGLVFGNIHSLEKELDNICQLEKINSYNLIQTTTNVIEWGMILDQFTIDKLASINFEDDEKEAPAIILKKIYETLEQSPELLASLDLSTLSLIRKKLAYDFAVLPVDQALTKLYASDGFFERMQKEEERLKKKDCKGEAAILDYLAQENEFCEVIWHAKENANQERYKPLIEASTKRMKKAAENLTLEALESALSDRFEPNNGEYKKAGGILNRLVESRRT